MDLLNRLFPPPVARKREKPDEILFAFDERPSAGILVGAATQHAMLALMLGIYAVIAGQAIGLSGPALVHYSASCFFLLGLGSILQACRSRFTPGVPLISVPNVISFGAYVAVVTHYGVGAAMGAILVANLIIMLAARSLPRMRAIFPPEVIGVVVLMLGLSMVAGGVRRSTGLDHGTVVSGGAILTAAATVACIVGLSVWGAGRWRAMAVLVGMIGGVAVAILSGTADSTGMGQLAELPAITLPIVSAPWVLPTFVPAAIAAILLTELLSAMDQFAGALTIDKLSDAQWHRADMSMVARSVTACAIANFLHGLAGTLTSGSAAANIGLAHSTGIMSRHVGLLAGALLCLVSFIPVIPGLVVLTPPAVIGGIMVYTSSFMIVAGMDLILSRLLNTQRTFTVGLAIVLGTSIMIVPELSLGAPPWSRMIVESGLTIGSATAIALNALFRIGIRRHAELALDDDQPGAAAAAFLEQQGKGWGARKDVVARAATGIGETLEALDTAGVRDGPARLLVSFDEFNLVCRLFYTGVPLDLTPAAPIDVQALLDDEDDSLLHAASMRLSAQLITRLADRVHGAMRGTEAEMMLSFDH